MILIGRYFLKYWERYYQGKGIEQWLLYKSRSGYGLSVPKKTCDKFFSKDWSSVNKHIKNDEVVININDTFWSTCNELRSKENGMYLIEKELGEWDIGKPHELNLTIYSYREFMLEI